MPLLLPLLVPSLAIGQEVFEFHVGEPATPEFWDPFSNKWSKTAYRVCAMIYQPLYRWDDSAAEKVLPILADRAEMTGDEVTVYLRSGALWHGTQKLPVTAEDVVFSYSVARDDALANKLNPMVRALGKYVVAVKVIDPQTVRFTMQRGVRGDALRYLTLPILPKHIFLRQGAFAGCTDPVYAIGSGPVRVRSWNDQNQVLIMDVFGDYYARKTNLRPFFKIVQSDDARIQQLKLGGISFLAEVPPNELAGFQDNPAMYKIENYASYSFSSIVLNFKNPTLQNLDVRKALMYCLNRELILENIYQNEGSLVNGPFAPATTYSHPQSIKYTYNPARADSHMEAAGFRKSGEYYALRGQRAKLRLLHYAASVSDDRKKVAAAIRRNLLDLGIEVEPEEEADFGNFRRRVFEKGDFDLVLLSWDYDPGASVGPLFYSRKATREGTEYNCGHYDSRVANGFIETFENAPTVAERGMQARLLDRHLNQDLPYLWLWTTEKSAVFNTQTRTYRGVWITPLTIFDTLEDWWAE